MRTHPLTERTYETFREASEAKTRALGEGRPTLILQDEQGNFRLIDCPEPRGEGRDERMGNP